MIKEKYNWNEYNFSNQNKQDYTIGHRSRKKVVGLSDPPSDRHLTMYCPINLERVNSPLSGGINDHGRSIVQSLRVYQWSIGTPAHRESSCWRASILGKQTGRDPGWKPMSKIRWPIYRGWTMRPPGTKGIRGDGQVPRDSPYRFKINTAYLDVMCQHKGTRSHPLAILTIGSCIEAN